MPCPHCLDTSGCGLHPWEAQPSQDIPPHRHFLSGTRQANLSIMAATSLNAYS